jgi:ABC-2 type transport system ATP-binding protein
LEDVSLHVNTGEIFGLLGPNGAGKTTLIRIINRIIEPDNGVVRFKGDIMTQQHLQYIGYLPEERGLYKSMTVEEHGVFLGQLRGLTKKDALAKLNMWLEKFDSTEWRHKRIEELSKGMAQKVQFICTVLHEPQLLILDEPLSGFDPINIELIKQELIEQKMNGKTVILSSHNMNSVEEMCDRVALIHQSKKLVEGTISELREERKSGLIAVKFKGNMIAFVNALWAGFEIVDKEILGDDRFLVKLKLRRESTFEDVLRISMASVQIEGAWEILPSMQDVFVELVQPIKTAEL